MVCCKCNKSGTCRECACAKVESPCVSCLPLKLGKCVNPMNSRKSSLSSSQPPPAPSISDLNSHLPTPTTNTSDLKSNLSTPTSNSNSATSDLTSHQSTSATTDLTSNLDSAVPSSAPPSLTLHQDGECSRNEESESVLGDWSLPATPPIADPSFNWGPLDAQSFIDLIDKAFNDVVHWKLNLFHVPFGRAGKQFVSELARLYSQRLRKAPPLSASP